MNENTGRRAGLEAYLLARTTIIVDGYQDEIDYVRNIKPISEQKEADFFREFVWVVLNAGMKEQIARKIFDKYFDSCGDSSVIGHKGKRDAIEQGFVYSKKWFEHLQLLHTTQSQLNFFESLPWVGPITKYHLARNLGIDCVKPDRHLVNWAKRLGYVSPYDMCRDIQYFMDDPQEKLGVIDVILWRYCNLYGVP